MCSLRLRPKSSNPAKLASIKPRASLILLVAAAALVVFFNWRTSPPVLPAAPQPTSPRLTLPPATPTRVLRSIDILVDDFGPQPYSGDAVYFYNRLDGDRGAINNATVRWGAGRVTTTVSPGNSWAGVWMSLNHPVREGLAIDLSAVLPAPILPAYQSRLTGITVEIVQGTAQAAFRLELKNGNTLLWTTEVTLEGGRQTFQQDLPPLGAADQLVWVLEGASPGDFVALERVSFTATTSITDTATAAFVWSYGMLLSNWNPATGLVRDKAKDASGELDATQATGCLAAATVVAAQLGIVGHDEAVLIVDKIGDTLLHRLPRFHGLWPHWTKTSPTGEISIVENTEWSSVDTVIAAVGLLEAQSGLGLDTSGTEQMLEAIDWNALLKPGGISHGYTYSGDLIPAAWDVFGGESWLVDLAYAAATGQVAPLPFSSPPTANGSGFIDELAWVFVPPPSGEDYWGNDWESYRAAAAEKQVGYPQAQDQTACLAELGLFGLSAGEVPSPSKAAKESVYQAFGIGGRFAAPKDSVVTPHYSAMIASLQPEAAVAMWARLMNAGYFSPLNNVESLAFPAGSACESASMEWNQLKGSWNLSLQTLGWGRYLAERSRQNPILWQAISGNPFMQQGYFLLAPHGPASQTKWSAAFECEYPAESTTGQMIWIGL